MAGLTPLRYEATGALIRRGDVVLVPVGARAAKAVVKNAVRKTRKVEVWLPKSRLARHNAVVVRFRRVDVTPQPWLRPCHLPFVLFGGAA